MLGHLGKIFHTEEYYQEKKAFLMPLCLAQVNVCDNVMAGAEAAIVGT